MNDRAKGGARASQSPNYISPPARAEEVRASSSLPLGLAGFGWQTGDRARRAFFRLFAPQ